MQGSIVSSAGRTKSVNEKAALQLAESGYRIFPCNPNNKAPQNGVKWKQVATSDVRQIEAWWTKWPDALPGLPTGSANGVAVVDLDVREHKDGVAAYLDLGLDPEDAAMVVRTAGGGKHLYFENADDIRNSTSSAGIDVRGEGGYVIAPGAVSKTGSYTVEKGDPRVAQLLLTAFPQSLTRSFSSSQNISHCQYKVAELAEALFRIPNDLPYAQWVRILMAVHHATAGSRPGLSLVQAWSADYTGYDSKEVSRKWRSFGKVDAPAVTADTLFAEARNFGWLAVSPNDFDDDPEELPGSEFLLGEEASKSADTGGLTFLTPDQCAELPIRDYVIKMLIAPGQIGCIFGEPGAGKSLFAPRLGYAVARGEDVFGLRTKQGQVFYIACEDEDGMAGRVAALCGDLGVTDGFQLVQGCGDLFSRGQVEGKGSPDLEALVKQVRLVRPSLIVIDTLAMAMPGLEENDAAGMNRVVQIGKRLAQTGAAVIFVHHGTKAEGNTPRGHSVFNGALDFSIMVRTADRNGIVRGKIRKNRNGSPDLDFAFRIGSRHLGYDIDSESVEAPICLPCSPGDPEDNPILTSAEAAAFTLYMEMSDGVELNITDWRKAATDGLTVSGSDNRASRQKAVSRALSGLVKKGRIAVENGLMFVPRILENDDWDDIEEDQDSGGD